MQISKKQKGIILIIVGIFLIILLLFFQLKDNFQKYKVVFDSDGGSKINTIIVKKNERIKQPEDPVKEGYLFEGWYYKNSLFDFKMKITSDIVLKAKWLKEETLQVRLDLNELSLSPGATHTLYVENTTKQKLKWISSDSNIVSVDEKGNLKALQIGEVIITVMTEDEKYKDTCKVIVTNDLINVTSISISGSSEVTVGRTILLSLNIQPTNASNKTVTWKSSNNNIATVDKFGRVKGLRAGKVTITVTTSDGNKTAKKNITVKEVANTNNNNNNNNSSSNQEQPTNQLPNTNIAVLGVKIEGDSTVSVNDSIQLKASIEPSNATNKNVQWTSSNETILSVDNKGKVVGLKEGEAVITVTTEEGNYKDSKTIKVITTYEIVFTKKYNNYKVPVGYELTVYKNKEPFNDFTAIIYKGNTKKFADFFGAMDEIDETEKTASIKINNIIIDNVPVKYK